MSTPIIRGYEDADGRLFAFVNEMIPGDKPLVRLADVQPCIDALRAWIAWHDNQEPDLRGSFLAVLDQGIAALARLEGK